MNRITTALLGTSIAVGLALSGGSAFAADLMAPPPVAAVETSGGGYVSVFGGYGLATNVNGYSTASSTNVSMPLGAGYVLGGAIGTTFTKGVRGEVELSYASHSALGNSVTFQTGNGSAYADGTSATMYLLGNVWFDLDTGSGITPYIGGGVGAAYVMPNISLDGGIAGFNTNAWALAGQLGAGVKIAVADNVSLDLGYRAKEVFNATLVGSGVAGNFTGVSYLDQAVTVGVDIGF